MASTHIAPTQPAVEAPSLATRPSEDDTRRRVGKKLQKRRRDGLHYPTVDFPDYLKESTRGADDEEDVRAAPQGNMFMNMNQSIFGMIAAAGSTVDFNDRFEGQSSDDDEHELDDEHRRADAMDGSLSEARHKVKGQDLAQTSLFKRHSSFGSRSKGDRHKRKLSGSKLMQSLPSLPSRFSSRSKKTSRLKQDDIQEEESEPASSTDPDDVSKPPDIEVTREEGRLAPVMSRMLEAKAEMAARPSFDLERLSSEQAREADGRTGPSALAKRLMEIFQFDHAEEVIEEYPCWLLQSVLLQGYMYITAKHICFYAYLPKKANEVAKSGYLAKCGKRNPKYNRHWFRLKGDVLAYYADAKNLYFPSGQIDLRYAISASITDKDKDQIHFEVVTHNRRYYLRADSAPSAKEWVKSLQRIIFRAHNEGDSVKISLPIENVIDVDETQMVDLADTCKVRVIDNDETYAIDEYFFSFFQYGREAINVLKILIDDASQRAERNKHTNIHTQHSTRALTTETSSASSQSRARKQLQPLQIEKARSSKISEGVRATLAPVSPSTASPRASGEMTRSTLDVRNWGRRSLDFNRTLKDASRRSFSGSRRSVSRDRRDGHRAHEKQSSTDSYVQSLEPSIASVSGLITSESEDPSASQILQGSDYFHRPTVRRASSASRAQDRSRDSAGARTPTSGAPGFTKRHAATTGTLVDSTATDSASQHSPSLQEAVAKVGTYPLQRATLYAGWLNRQSRRMSNLLATESMGYVEKVSGMWKGGRKHYDEPDGLRTDGEGEDDDPDKVATSMERFRAHFALPATEKLQATFFAHIHRVLPLYGKIYISDRNFCFRSLLPGTKTKLILPLRDVENVNKEKGFRFGYSGLVLVVRGHEELFFEFNQADARDDCAITLLQTLEAAKFMQESGLLGKEEKEDADMAAAERDALQEARLETRPEHEASLPPGTNYMNDSPTILFDDPRASFLNFKPPKPLRITCLTIGSRGDVQPYIALSKGLLAEGHQVKIATHPEFESWIRGHGIDFGRVEGDPGELMRICIENGTFTFQFLKEANSKMRTWLDELLASAWEACQGSDLLIESPSAMAGIHIAEKLQIPYFRAFTMPWTRTRAYPHAFVTPEHKMGGYYNYITYVMFDNVFWKATATQINKWRKTQLELPPTNLDKMQPNKVPFLYNFSPCVVPPPMDFSDWIRVTGYWFLNEGTVETPLSQVEDDKGISDAPALKPSWTPPKDLSDFIENARRDGKKIVYVGFGSILVPDPAKLTQEVIDAVLKADVRCILSKGWSDRMVTSKDKERAAQLAAEAKDKNYSPNHPPVHDNSKVEVPLPSEIFQIKSAPHDWLFAQIDAAAHHGGSGTTGASLRAGIPTIIRPFFGDQFFFGNRVEDLGVGICLKKWGANSFARALWEATNSERMIVKARVLGEQIRSENGVEQAIQSIYRDLEYAHSLVMAKVGKRAAATEVDEEPEESWTFVEEDFDPMQQSVILNPDGGHERGGVKASGSRILGTTYE